MSVLQAVLWKKCKHRNVPEDDLDVFGEYATELGLQVSRVVENGYISCECHFMYPDPVSGLPRDPRTGLLCDPETGLLCESQTGAPSSAAGTSHAVQEPPRDPPYMQDIFKAFAECSDHSCKGKNLVLPNMIHEIVFSENSPYRGFQKLPTTSPNNPDNDVSFIVGEQAKIVPTEPDGGSTPPGSGTYDLKPIPKSKKVAIVSGVDNRYYGLLPLPRTDCMLFGDTCVRTWIMDSKVEGMHAHPFLPALKLLILCYKSGLLWNAIS